VDDPGVRRDADRQSERIDPRGQPRIGEEPPAAVESAGREVGGTAHGERVGVELEPVTWRQGHTLDLFQDTGLELAERRVRARPTRQSRRRDGRMRFEKAEAGLEAGRLGHAVVLGDDEELRVGRASSGIAERPLVQPRRASDDAVLARQERRQPTIELRAGAIGGQQDLKELPVQGLPVRRGPQVIDRVTPRVPGGQGHGQPEGPPRGRRVGRGGGRHTVP
jgi:hypothetical protein